MVLSTRITGEKGDIGVRVSRPVQNTMDRACWLIYVFLLILHGREKQAHLVNATHVSLALANLALANVANLAHPGHPAHLAHVAHLAHPAYLSHVAHAAHLAHMDTQ